MSGDGADYESVGASSHKWHRARKGYRCCGCEAAIERGELYHRTSAVSDGRWTVNRHCAACWAILDHLWAHGVEQVQLGLDCGHTYDAPEDDPGHALAFMTKAEAQAYALADIAKNGPDAGAPGGGWILG